MNENIVREGMCPSSTSLRDGFGDCCDLGVNSVAARWTLHGRDAQRAASKSRSSWGRAYRLIREYISFKAIAWRSSQAVMSDKRLVMSSKKILVICPPPSFTDVRLVVDKSSRNVRQCFGTGSRQPREFFDQASVALRFLFEFALCVVRAVFGTCLSIIRQASTILRLASKIFGKFPKHYEGNPELGDKLSGSVMRYCSKNGRLADAWRSLHKVEMTEREVEMTGGKTSTKVRQLFDTPRYPIGTCSQTALLLLRQLFDKCSTALRLFFDNDSKGCRRTVEEQWENPRRNVGAGIAQVIIGYGRQWDSSRSSVGERGVNSRLIPCVFLVYLSVFLAKRAQPALSLPKPCLSPTLALGKKYRLIGPFFGFLISFHMILFCVCLAHARQQGLGTPVATGVALSTDSIKPLKIGDTIPEALWNKPLQMVKAGQEGGTTVRLNDYRGKLIILDFWATWCGPCLKMLPKSDSLQRTYTKDLAILPVTYQSKKEVLQVLKNNNKLSLPFIINDTLLKKFFPHFYLPHYVWIGADGKVKAITDHYRLTDASIREMLAEETTSSWSVKEDSMLHFERGQTLLDVFKSGVNPPMLFESILTGYIEGLPGGYEIIPNAPDGHYKIIAVNMPMVKLYALAFGGGERYIGNNSMLLETSRKNELMPTYKGDAIIQWAKGNNYCLEVSVPKADWKEAYVTMQEQLNKFFKTYHVKLEPITRTVIAMKKLADFSNKIVSTNLGKPYSTFSNYGFELKGKSLDLLIAQLNVIYMQHSPYPIVNATGVDKPVDLKIEAELVSLKSLNKALQPYGLQLVEEEQTVQTLVFRDK
ncbi:MAG TPA: TlpA disulfide reductase family protein [Pseudosphingobacterium sp.]|nr:TlpA disulfide reductase family protein [Pseudosphingobacterium sp.]